MFSKIWGWVAYWYWRYTVVTELYMVEKWERYTINSIFIMTFLFCWFFNYAVVLGAVGKMLSILKAVDSNHIKTISI